MYGSGPLAQRLEEVSAFHVFFKSALSQEEVHLIPVCHATVQD